jgi:FixJ family two-component response regulator
VKRLSPRQAEILVLRRAGLTERQIADALGLRYRTVQEYSRHLHAAGWLPGRHQEDSPGLVSARR